MKRRLATPASGGSKNPGRFESTVWWTTPPRAAPRVGSGQVPSSVFALLGVVVATVGDGALDVGAVAFVLVAEAFVGEVAAGGPEVGTGAVVVDPAAAAADAGAVGVEVPAVGAPAVGRSLEFDFVVVVAVGERDAVGADLEGLDSGLNFAGSLDAARVVGEVEADGFASVGVVEIVTFALGGVLGDELLVSHRPVVPPGGRREFDVASRESLRW